MRHQTGRGQSSRIFQFTAEVLNKGETELLNNSSVSSDLLLLSGQMMLLDPPD